MRVMIDMQNTAKCRLLPVICMLISAAAAKPALNCGNIPAGWG
jgi:hypothetical protein